MSTVASRGGVGDDPQMPDSRIPLVAGNWKMHMLRADARAYATTLCARTGEIGDVDIAICPPLTSLADIAAILVPAGIGVYAQNAHQAPSGAFTGEVAMAMLVDAGATGVLLGHSERRQHFGESDDALAEKVPAALDAGLDAVLCVGETDAEREAGATEERIAHQVTRALTHVAASRIGDVTIAYEPVWAIGTGKTANPLIAQTTHRLIRSVLEARYDAEAAASVRILYGGSVKPDNAGELFAQPDIDGGLIGGASLAAPEFLAICACADR